MARLSPLLIIITSATLLFCSGLPRFDYTTTLPDKAIIRECQSPFIKKPMRLVHSIDATLPGRHTATFIGITVADPRSKRLHSSILSIEGFVLCDVVYDGKLKINRAIGPFNSREFLKGMMRDIGLILFTPRAKLIKTGVSYRGLNTCRYLWHDTVTDIAVRENRWQIYHYGKNMKKTRRVTVSDIVESGLPGRIDLASHGFGRYRLRLNLVRAEVLD
jgi:hypothetical protein